MAKMIRLPHMPWHGPRELSLLLPDNWQVETYNMAGYDRRAMKPSEIRAAIINTIGTQPIKELAKGKKEVVILFDDMSRITNVKQIVHFVLKELEEAGIPDSRIRFISALGAHGAMNRLDFAKKLGEKTLLRFPIYNHNPFGKCVYIGTTQYGMKIFLNAEVMKCDFKIGIGSIVPHPMPGFGGGAKILIPGVASIETIESLHRLGSRVIKEHADKPVTGMGIFEGNPLRLNIEEVGTLASLDIKIDCLVNTWGETIAVYAGVPKLAHAAGVKEAKAHYLTPRVVDKDIVIANTFAKVNEFDIGMMTALPAVSQEGGDIVLICDVPEGHVTHYLLGLFGNKGGSKFRLRIGLPTHVNHLIIFNKYPEITSKGYFREENKVLFMNKWEEVLLFLQKLHKNIARVAVFPNVDIQYFG